MLKFLRKYNKIILVVFGCFLMVVFLVPQGLTQLFRNSEGPIRATYAGGNIRQMDWARASVEVDLVSALWPTLTQALEIGEESAAHWILLAYEAEQGGFVGEYGDGQRQFAALVQRTALASFAQQAQQIGYPPQVAQQVALQAWNNPDFAREQLGINLTREEVMAQVEQRMWGIVESRAGQARMNERDVHRAFARATGIERMLGTYLQAAAPSDRRAMIEAKRVLDQVQADTVFLPATLLLDDVPEPTDEQVREQFEAYRDARPGEGEFGIGYTLPDRVKFETMTVNARAIRDSIQPDLVDIRKRFGANPTRYSGTFEENEERIRQDLIAERTDEVLRAARQAFAAEVFLRTQNLKADGLYKVLPDGWEPIDFERIAQVIVDNVLDSTGVRIELPVVQTRASKWWTGQDILGETDLRGAQWRVGQRAYQLARALIGVRELDPESGLGVQVGLAPTEPATTFDGSLIFFQVLDARAESPPDSPDEIRETVAKDWRELRAYEQLAGRLEELRSTAVQSGLEAAIDLVAPPPPAPEAAPETTPETPPAEPSEPGGSGSVDGDQPEGEPATPESQPEVVPETETQPEATQPEQSPDRPAVRRNVVIAREFTSAQPELDAEAFRTAAMERAAGIDPLKPVEEITPEESVFAAAIPISRGVGLGRITRVEPLTIERYQLAVQTIASQISAGEVIPKLKEMSPFTLERLKERHGWKELGAN